MQASRRTEPPCLDVIRVYFKPCTILDAVGLPRERWGAKKEAGEDIGRPEKESRQETANQGEKTGRKKIGEEKISREKISGEEEAVVQTRIACSVLIAYFSS